MRDTQPPKSACPNCGKVLDGALHLGDAVPTHGSLSLCANCGDLCEFGPNLELIRPSDEALAAVDLDKLRAVRSIWKSFKEKVDAQAPAGHSR